MAFVLVAAQVRAQMVISQIYGGGGNGGATLKNDFIELFNAGTSNADLTGWSVQYASDTGTTWQVTLLAGTLQPGQYYLVQEGSGGGGTTNLPTPDATGSILLSATAGKVALANRTTSVGTIACPGSAEGVVDFVGYGSGADCFEGSGPAAAPSDTTADLRAGAGCTDSNDNAADFSTAAPNPRNSSSPFNECPATPTPTGTPTQTPTSTGTATATTTPRAGGADCASPSDCQSTFCVDAVCCDTACDAPSEQCDLTGRRGTCTRTAATAPTLSGGGALVACVLLAAMGLRALTRRR